MAAVLGAVAHGVGQHLEDLAGFVPVLQVRPVLGRQQVGVMLEERLFRMRLETEEFDELFRENVVRPHVVPGTGPHLVDVVARLGHAAEIAVGHEAQLVVVVEDDPPVP